MRFAGGLAQDTRLAERQALRASWSRDDVAVYGAEITTLGLRNTDQAAVVQQLDESLGPLGVVRASPFAYGPDTVTWDLVTNWRAVGLTAAQLASKLDQASPYLRLEVLETRAVVSGEGNRSAARSELDTRVAADAPSRNPITQAVDALKGFGLTVGAMAIIGIGAYLYLTRRQ